MLVFGMNINVIKFLTVRAFFHILFAFYYFCIVFLTVQKLVIEHVSKIPCNRALQQLNWLIISLRLDENLIYHHIHSFDCGFLHFVYIV